MSILLTHRESGGFGNDTKTSFYLRSNEIATGGNRFADHSSDENIIRTPTGSNVVHSIVQVPPMAGMTSSIFLPGGGAACGEYIYVEESDSFRFSNDSFTIDLWLYAVSAATGFGGIFGAATFPTAAAMYQLYFETSDNTLNFYNNYTGAGSERLASPPILLNTWYHLTIAREGMNWYMFLDNNLVDTLTLNWSTDLPVGADFTIGRPYSAGLDSHYFGGYINDLRISSGICRNKRTLHVPDRRWGHRQQYTGGENCVLLITAEEEMATATTFTEWSRSRHTVNIFGTAMTPDPNNRVVGAYSWDDNGTQAPLNHTYFRINDSLGDFGPAAAEDYTIDCWLWLDSVQTGMGSWGLFTTDVYTAATVINVLLIGAPTGMALYNSGAARINGGAAPFDTWFHFALVRSVNVWTMYYNGTPVGGTWNDGGINFNCPSHALVMCRHWETRRYLNGKIDNFRVTKGEALWTANFAGSLPTERRYYEG